METPLVRINLDRQERIEELYGIGPELAGEIVLHRSEHGDFNGPDDLATVEGISSNLAFVVSPHIDWRKSDYAEFRRKRSMAGIGISLIILALSLLFAVWNAGAMIFGVLTSFGDESKELELLVGFTARSGAMAFGVLCAAANLWSEISTNLVRHRILKRAAFLFLGATVGIIGIGMISNFFIEFIEPSVKIFGDPRPIPLILILPPVMIIGLMVAGPVLLIVWRPRLGLDKRLVRVFDVGVLFMCLYAAVFVWISQFTTVTILYLAIGFIGLIGILWGIDVLRGQYTLHTFLVENVYSQEDLQAEGMDVRGWHAWVNAEFPDPEVQLELKRALDRKFPLSRTRSAFGIIVIGLGGWLLGTTVGSIIEWAVQNVLEGRGIFQAPP